MRIVFFGTPQFAVPTLQALLAQPEMEVVAVVTQPDKRRGRGNQLSPSPVKQVALEHQLPVWQPQRVKKDADTLAQLRSAQADYFVVVAYGQILSQEMLDMPRFGCINGHGSLLPKYRGAAPIQWSLYHGEAETGMTTMLMDAGMDTGAMLLKGTVPIELLDNAHTLAAKLATLGATLMVETLPKLATGDITPIPQDPAEATYAPLIQKADYELNWSREAIGLHNQIRGFYPNCVTSWRGESLKILATVPLTDDLWEQLPAEIAEVRSHLQFAPTSQPGQVMQIVKGLGPIVETGHGLLLLQEVQMAGKRVQSGWDFANGSRLETSEILGTV